MGELILIVDDNLTNRRLVGVLLEREGYGVRTAGDAREALELLKTFHPRLVLMDIQLPGMSGLDLTRCLKANTETGKIIVVAFSGCAIQETKQKALDAGCDGYISKPIAPRHLMQLVAQYLQTDNGKQQNPHELHWR
jgi:two-component system cell cycle response regulator